MRRSLRRLRNEQRGHEKWMPRKFDYTRFAGMVPPADLQISEPVAILRIEPEPAVVSLDDSFAPPDPGCQRFRRQCYRQFLAGNRAGQFGKHLARTWWRVALGVDSIPKTEHAARVFEND